MTDERLAKLQEVGFVFELQPNGPRFLKATGRGQELQTRNLEGQRSKQQVTIQAGEAALQDNGNEEQSTESQYDYGAKHII